MASAGILGVVLLSLYGDRTPYYQSPDTYKQGYTKLTPLGQEQELQLGSYLRSQYLNPNSPSYINGIFPDVVDDRQLYVRADNGGEGGAIVDSAVALLQGLYPPTSRSRTTLANGTTVVGPLGGYQYVPIESVEPIQSIHLEGWSSCPSFEKHIKQFYDSKDFQDKAKEAAPFLNAVKPYLFGIPNTLENIWNVYDYLSTNYIHNETYAFRLPPTFLQQAQSWVDYHEHGVFTDKNPAGIGNIAGRTMIPSIVKSLERIANKNDPLLLSLQEISYKPLISLLNITEVTDVHPELAGLPGYASTLALELRNDEEGETFVRTRFTNGTSGFETIHLYGHKGDIALNELLYRLDLAAVYTTAQWCRVCNQRSERGCGSCYTDGFVGLAEKAESNCSDVLRSMTSTPASVLAVSSFALLFAFGLFKLYQLHGRRRERAGYEPLPTAVQTYDAAEVKRRETRF